MDSTWSATGGVETGSPPPGAPSPPLPPPPESCVDRASAGSASGTSLTPAINAHRQGTTAPRPSLLAPGVPLPPPHDGHCPRFLPRTPPCRPATLPAVFQNIPVRGDLPPWSPDHRALFSTRRPGCRMHYPSGAGPVKPPSATRGRAVVMGVARDFSRLSVWGQVPHRARGERQGCRCHTLPSKPPFFPPAPQYKGRLRCGIGHRCGIGDRINIHQYRHHLNRLTATTRTSALLSDTFTPPPP